MSSGLDEFRERNRRERETNTGCIASLVHVTADALDARELIGRVQNATLAERRTTNDQFLEALAAKYTNPARTPRKKNTGKGKERQVKAHPARNDLRASNKQTTKKKKKTPNKRTRSDSPSTQFHDDSDDLDDTATCTVIAATAASPAISSSVGARPGTAAGASAYVADDLEASRQLLLQSMTSSASGSRRLSRTPAPSPSRPSSAKRSKYVERPDDMQFLLFQDEIGLDSRTVARKRQASQMQACDAVPPSSTLPSHLSTQEDDD